MDLVLGLTMEHVCPARARVPYVSPPLAAPPPPPPPLPTPLPTAHDSVFTGAAILYLQFPFTATDNNCHFHPPHVIRSAQTIMSDANFLA